MNIAEGYKNYFTRVDPASNTNLRVYFVKSFFEVSRESKVGCSTKVSEKSQRGGLFIILDRDKAIRSDRFLFKSV